MVLVSSLLQALWMPSTAQNVISSNVKASVGQGTMVMNDWGI
jgi:hypothetical protein